MDWQGDVEGTDELAGWYRARDETEQEYIDAAIDIQEEIGPALGRPFVDHVKGSRHANMKELRPLGGNIRIFFAFNPIRNAILLIGGDKTHRWKAFYDKTIPVADQLYDVHLGELRKEGKIE